MATDGIRQRRGRTDNSLVHVYNTKELFAALQKAKEDEETLKSKMARVMVYNSFYGCNEYVVYVCACVIYLFL